MAQFVLEWHVEGVKELSRVLLDTESNLKDFKAPFKDSADYLVRTFSKDVFETQGRAIGERWKRLSPYTIAQRARLGFFGPPLVRTGRMQQGFRSIVSSTQATVYNDTNYFKYHQSRGPRTRLPRRAMMALGNTQKETIVRYFQAHMRESMRSQSSHV